MTKARDVASNGGLVLITKQDFSAASSISINNCFSSIYTNYQAVFNITSSSTSAILQGRLRVGGTDNSTASSYVRQRWNIADTSASGSAFNYSYYDIISDLNTVYQGVRVEFYRPFLAETTGLFSYAGNNTELGLFSAVHNQSVSYDGVTFFPNTGTITGTVRIYGLRD